jgi:hypothetical protein
MLMDLGTFEKSTELGHLEGKEALCMVSAEKNWQRGPFPPIADNIVTIRDKDSIRVNAGYDLPGRERVTGKTVSTGGVVPSPSVVTASR